MRYSGGNLCDSSAWKLVFNDEFTGDTLNTNKWHTYFPYGPNGSDSCLFCRTHTTTIASKNERQIYTDSNVIVNDGLLKLILKKDNPTWMGARRPYSSGMVYSKLDIFRFQRGKFEIRCKLPSGANMWPAFWLFGSDREIDVFEFRRGSVTNMEMSLHKWLQNGTSNHYSDPYKSKIDYSKDFHTFAVEWDKEAVTWFVDSIEVNRIYRLAYNNLQQRTVDCSLNNGNYTQYDWFPTEGQLNVSVGLGTEKRIGRGSFGAPRQFEVDYIRVYQREPEPWFPPLCDIKGANRIRPNEDATFQIGADIGAFEWSTSTNLVVVSRNSTSITVRSKPETSFGTAWIKANFKEQSACTEKVSIKNFKIGEH